MTGATLLRRFMAFLAAVIALLSVGFLWITSGVTRSGLEDLFVQRIERADVVLDQYARGRYLTRLNEIEPVLTSPRFLAAMETADPATISLEVPDYPALVDPEFALVMDPRGESLYVSEGFPAELRDGLLEESRRAQPDFDVIHVPWSGRIYEFVLADVSANNGTYLGRLAVGADLSDAYLTDLEMLTGFEICLARDGQVLSQGDGSHDHVGSLLASSTSAPGISRVDVEGEDYLVHRLEEPVSGLTVMFVASLDEPIVPIMGRVRGSLLALAAGGALVALLVVYAYARRHVQTRLRNLVGYAETIAAGDLDTVIQPGSSDEFGYLEGEFEKMRERLARNRDELEAAHDQKLDSERMAALGRFATGIIHDFKNPMAVVLGTTDLIQAKAPENEKLVKNCSTIRRQVERMVSLTRDILDYANGRSVLDVDEVVLGPFFEEIRSSHEDACKRAGVKLVLDGRPATTVTIDPGRMRRVIDNLVTNAREVSGLGDTIWIRWGRVADEFAIRVKDSGPGVPEEIADRIFDPFVTSGKDGGSGLGLAIARKVVEDHGGNLRVENGEPGACFVIALPLKLEVAMNAREKETVG